MFSFKERKMDKNESLNVKEAIEFGFLLLKRHFCLQFAFNEAATKQLQNFEIEQVRCEFPFMVRNQSMNK